MTGNMDDFQVFNDEDEDYEIITKHIDVPFKYVWCGENRVFMYAGYKKYQKELHNFPVRSDDVWILSYPKAGTTWTQEMIWCIMNGFDSNESQIPIQKRIPFFEFQIILDGLDFNGHLQMFNYTLQSLHNMPSPRFIKTHLPWHMLPKQLQNGAVKPKMIYVLRNPKDVCVSYYNHYKIFKNFRGSIEEFCRIFTKSKVPWGSIFDHIQSYLEQKQRTNLLIITYEEMRCDLKQVVEKAVAFMGQSLSDAEITKLVNHLSFENMKCNPAVNYQNVQRDAAALLTLNSNVGSFMNKGLSGYSKDVIPIEYQTILDQMCKDFEMKTDFKFQ